MSKELEVMDQEKEGTSIKKALTGGQALMECFWPKAWKLFLVIREVP